MHSFEEKGVILTDPQTDKSGDELLEVATEHAIEAGAEEVKVLEDNSLEFHCAKTSFGQVVQELEKSGYKITSASIEYTPVQYQNLNDSELEICKKLYDKLEALPEVVRLSDNIA